MAEAGIKQENRYMVRLQPGLHDRKKIQMG